MKIEARLGCRKICLKMGAEALLHNRKDEKEGCELSVKSLSGRVSQSGYFKLKK